MTDPLIESAKEIEALREKVSELDEWRSGERQYPPAVQDYKDLCMELKRVQFDLAAYLAEQEPRGWWNPSYPSLSVQLTKPYDGGGWEPFFTAPPEPAPNLYREIYEVWAGSEGIPIPRTAPEAYLLGLLEQMVDIAKTGMHMTEPAPQDSLKESSSPEHTSSTASDSRPACAAPSSEEVREMVERLRCFEHPNQTGEELMQEAADLIERLAARVTSPEQKPPAS